MTQATTSAYALLALLQLRPWTSYELTQQAHRSLRWAWPRSESHLYVDQKRLVRLGWARVHKEFVGRRARTHYAITPRGTEALRAWMATEPSAPRLEVEGALRLLFAESGTVDDLRASLLATASAARTSIDEGLAQVREYLETGGPFPERLNLIALFATQYCDTVSQIEAFCLSTADLVSTWDNVLGPADAADARRRLQELIERHGRS